MAQQLPRTLQPPPDLPDLGANQNTLATYLRSFSLWCRHGFARTRLEVERRQRPR